MDLTKPTTLERVSSQMQAVCSQISMGLVDIELIVWTMVFEDESHSPEYEVIAPFEVAQEVKQGLKLYSDYGGRKTWVLSEALAKGKPITSQQIDQMVSFFQDASLRKKKSEWNNLDNSSPLLVSWKLMGGDVGWLWSRTTKELSAAMKIQLSQQEFLK